MSHALIVAGSPSPTSRTLRFAEVIGQRLGKLGLDSSLLDLRGLPAEELLHARTEAPAIAQAVDRVRTASAIVFATPVYKAAYSGLLKTFIDLLPQFALRDKVVLPLALGGTPAHVLAIDYGLRPVLSSLDPLHLVSGLFVLDQHVIVQPEGTVELDGGLSTKLDTLLGAFVGALTRASRPPSPPSA